MKFGGTSVADAERLKRAARSARPSSSASTAMRRSMAVGAQERNLARALRQLGQQRDRLGELKPLCMPVVGIGELPLRRAAQRRKPAHRP